jgi:NAD-dependent dihydropyrimidine dehydrogenase PreA subunit
MAGLRYLSDVVTLKLDVEKCTGCGLCVTVCPHGVFMIEGRKARIVDRDACMECGACAKNCAFQAIAVRAGVGCATAILRGVLRGSEAGCGCSTGSSCCSCGDEEASPTTAAEPKAGCSDCQ